MGASIGADAKVNSFSECANHSKILNLLALLKACKHPNALVSLLVRDRNKFHSKLHGIKWFKEEVLIL